MIEHPEAGPELLVLAKWEECTGWLLQHASNWPESVRFGLVQRADDHGLDVTELLIVVRFEPKERRLTLREVTYIEVARPRGHPTPSCLLGPVKIFESCLLRLVDPHVAMDLGVLQLDPLFIGEVLLEPHETEGRSGAGLGLDARCDEGSSRREDRARIRSPSPIDAEDEEMRRL